MQISHHRRQPTDYRSCSFKSNSSPGLKPALGLPERQLKLLLRSPVPIIPRRPVVRTSQQSLAEAERQPGEEMDEFAVARPLPLPQTESRPKLLLLLLLLLPKLPKPRQLLLL